MCRKRVLVDSKEEINAQFTFCGDGLCVIKAGPKPWTFIVPCLSGDD